MGNLYSIIYDQDDMYSEIDEHVKIFIQHYCIKGKEYNVNNIVLLQNFQKYLLLQIDHDTYEKWSLAHSPKARLNFILKNLDNDKYILNETHINGIALL